MPYTKTVWKNREVERPRTYISVTNPDGTITLTSSEGNIIEAGTPIIADNMNKIEVGIETAQAAAEAAQSITPGDIGAAPQSELDALETTVTSHLAEKATEAALGHVIIGTGLDVTAGGVVSVETDTGKFKKASSSFTDNDTSQTFTDAFCTANSLVTVVITSATPPQGVWSVESGAGSFTITSTVAESADITFDYYIQKAVG